MNSVKLADDWLIINFPYDAKVVGGVREIPGRIYDPINKIWKVPVRFLSQAREQLAAFGFLWDPKLDEISTKEKIISITSDLPLYDFQKEGVLFLLNNERALLASDPGTGKSIQALVALEESGCKKILWVTLKSLCMSAEKEILKWYPDKKIVVISNTKHGISNRLTQYQGDYEVYILNYEKVRTDIEILKNFEWDAIVCDESTKISNSRAQVTKAASLLKAKRMILMSGTPMSNTPSDYFSQMNILVPGLLGTWYQFINRYCALDYFGHVESYKNLDHLKKVISPYMIRHAKRDVLKELPERVVEDIVFELNGKERKIYNAIKKEILAEIKHETLNKIDWGTINQVLVKMVRLRQCTGHLNLIGEETDSSKMSVLLELLETLPKNVIIFTQFSKMAAILHGHVKGSLLMTGDTKGADRQKIVDEFNENGQKPLVTTEVGGMGLNLQTASIIVNYDLPWSISKFEQRVGRIERIGAVGEKITVFNLIAKDSIDEFVKSTLEGKMKTAGEMLGEIKKILN